MNVKIVRSQCFEWTWVIIRLARYLLYFRSYKLHPQVAFISPYEALPFATVAPSIGIPWLEVDLLSMRPVLISAFYFHYPARSDGGSRVYFANLFAISEIQSASIAPTSRKFPDFHRNLAIFAYF